MSLKYFHVFFIATASLCLFFFGFWSVEDYQAGEAASLYYSLASFAGAFGLIAYGFNVWRKLKDVGFFLPAGLVLFLPDAARACATCYADPDSPVAKGLTAAVLFLLGVIGVVLAGFLALIVHYNRRSGRSCGINE